jgi:hypothetical protein
LLHLVGVLIDQAGRIRPYGRVIGLLLGQLRRFYLAYIDRVQDGNDIRIGEGTWDGTLGSRAAGEQTT